MLRRITRRFQSGFFLLFGVSWIRYLPQLREIPEVTILIPVAFAEPVFGSFLSLALRSR